MSAPAAGSAERFDVVVIGGGAAGMMCAFTAGQRGRRVALLEHNDRPGRKIAISGGGRCNFTNLHTQPENYLSENPNFCRSALARYTPGDFLGLVESHCIAYHEKKLGQQFCDGSSREIIEMLLAECAAGNVELRTGCRVLAAEKLERFRITTNAGEMSCESLVIATGGLSFAKLGATDIGYTIARQFGLRVTELRPGLVPLTLGSDDLARFQELSGVSLPVVARCAGTSFEEALLFTHRGLSGPAILQVSSYWREGEPLTLNLLPEGQQLVPRDLGSDLAAGMARYWPRRFAETWCVASAPAKPLPHYNKRDWQELENRVRHWSIRPAGSEGYPKAEVTLGGVDTRELSSKTMEARRVPGLYFIGEVVDVTGWLGGYNFQWAWASAHAAGEVV